MMNELINVDGQHGFVMLVDAMQIDPTKKVAYSARLSFGNEESQKPHSALVTHLAEEQHTSPFRHSPISLLVQAPEFVARQWYKHVVGGPYSFNDTGWNEISGRYVEYDKFYVPDEFYCQSKVNKQGSTDEVNAYSAYYRGWMIGSIESTVYMYNKMIANGVAKEQARLILPMSLYTRFVWTPTQQAVYHFVKLRVKKDAQREIRAYANVVNTICESHYGESWKALQESDGI